MKISFLAKIGISLVVFTPNKSFASVQNIKVWGDENISLGRGVAAAIGEGHISLRSPNCVLHDGLETPFEGSRLNLSVSSIKTNSELSRSVNSKFGVTAKDANEKIKAFSAAFNHADVKDSVSKSLTSVGEIRISKDFGFSQLKNPRPNPSLIQAIDNQNPYSLYEKCGDSFAYGYRRSTELSAYIICNANSRIEKKNLDQSFGGFGIYAGVNIGVDASQKINEITSHSAESCKVLLNSAGGRGSIDVSSPEAFIKSAVGYAVNSTIADAWVSEIEVLPYSNFVDQDFQAALASQMLEFPRAVEVSEPLRLAARNLVEDYLFSGSELTESNMKEVFDVLNLCIEKPWAYEETCVIDPQDDIDWWDVL